MLKEKPVKCIHCGNITKPNPDAGTNELGVVDYNHYHCPHCGRTQNARFLDGGIGGVLNKFSYVGPFLIAVIFWILGVMALVRSIPLGILLIVIGTIFNAISKR
ncbi:MAG: hypothetical protein ACK5LC_09930 [Coprobacillaceae bacterium]